MSPAAAERARGRAIVAVLFLSMGVTIGAAQYSFGLFVPSIEAQFGWSRTHISASLSFVAVGSLMAPLIGRLMDRIGARPILVCSLAVSAASYLARPLMSELWHWYALSFVQFAAFAGATVLPVGRLIGVWYGERRGRVMGVASAGPNFGGLVLPVMVAMLITAWTWEHAYVALGGVMAMVAVLAHVIIREAPERVVSSDPQASAGLDPNQGATVREALRCRAFYTITLATVAAFFTYSIVVPHVVVHMTNVGLSAQRASLLLGALALCGMAGKVGFGYLAERITARNAFIVDLVGQSVFVLLLAWTGPAGFVWLAPAYGFFLGGTGVLAPLIIQEFFGLKHFGAVSGLSSLPHMLSLGVGPIIAGLSFDRTGSYGDAFAIATVFFAFGALLLAFTRPAGGMR